MDATDSAATISDANTKEELLWTLVLLQHDAAQHRLREFQQQIEHFVLTTGTDPLTGDGPLEAAHGVVPLREHTRPASVAPLPLVSKFIVQLTSELCNSRGCVRDATAMAQFKASIESPELTFDDHAQVIMVLDRAFTENATLQSVFESNAGYNVLATWFTDVCSLRDEDSRMLASMLLQFLQRHKPLLPFGRKAIIATLRGVQKRVVGKEAKGLVKTTIELYRL